MTAIAVITLAAAILAWALIRAASRPVDSPDSSEGHGLSDGAAAAMEDIAGPMFGVDAHPTAAEALQRRIP